MSIPALAATFVVMAIFDGIWLTLVARNFYRDNLGHLLGDTTNWPPAIAFYVIYTIGAWYFATQPGVDDGSALAAAMRGAAFGFVAYATYDLTNPRRCATGRRLSLSSTWRGARCSPRPWPASPPGSR